MYFCCIIFVSLTTVNATQVRTGYYNRSYTLGTIRLIILWRWHRRRWVKQKRNLIIRKHGVQILYRTARAWRVLVISFQAMDIVRRYITISKIKVDRMFRHLKRRYCFYYCKSCSVHWCHVGIMINSSQSVEGNYNGKVSLVNGIYKDGNGHSLANGHITRRFIRPAYASAKPFHINIDSPKAGASTTSGITAEDGQFMEME